MGNDIHFFDHILGLVLIISFMSRRGYQLPGDTNPLS